MTTTTGKIADEPRDVVVLGSTGSIGTQALDVVAARPRPVPRGRAWPPAAADVALLAAQARAHGVRRVAVADPDAAARPAPRAARGRGARRSGRGHRAHRHDAAPTPSSTGSPARVAWARRSPRWRPGATLALANKESLVAGGAAGDGGGRGPGQIVPVDSEHSALAQCLRGGRGRRGRAAGAHRVRRPVPRPAARRAGRRHRRAGAGPPDLGHGPGRHHQLRDAGQQGPRGDRGAPAVRRALRPDRRRRAPAVGGALDGHLRRRSTIAQASPPDMRLPIALALGWPDRVAGAARRAPGTPRRPGRSSRWTTTRSPGCGWPAQAGEAGGCLPAVFNAANEEAVAAFVAGGLRFTELTAVVADTLAAADGWRADPAPSADVAAAEEWARAHAGAAVARRTPRSLGSSDSVEGSADPADPVTGRLRRGVVRAGCGAVRARHRGLDRAARGGPHVDGQGVRHARAPLLHRVRPQGLLLPPAARPSTASRRSPRAGSATSPE